LSRTSSRIHDWSQVHLPTPPRLGKERRLLRTYLHSCIVGSRNAITLKGISHGMHHKTQQMRHIQYMTATILVSWQDQRSLVQGKKTPIQRVPVQILFTALARPLPPWEDLAVVDIVSGCIGGRVADIGAQMDGGHVPKQASSQHTPCPPIIPDVYAPQPVSLTHRQLSGPLHANYQLYALISRENPVTEFRGAIRQIRRTVLDTASM
jgi:hypothetical protein